MTDIRKKSVFISGVDDNLVAFSDGAQFTVKQNNLVFGLFTFGDVEHHKNGMVPAVKTEPFI